MYTTWVHPLLEEKKEKGKRKWPRPFLQNWRQVTCMKSIASFLAYSFLIQTVNSPRAILSLPHSSGHRWAPEVASAVAKAHGQAEQRRGTSPLPSPLLVMTWQVSHLHTCPTKHMPAWAPVCPDSHCSTSCGSAVLRWYLGTRQGKQLVKSFNFYDTKTDNRVRGTGGTGPEINITLQTENKASYKCKNPATCTGTNTILFYHFKLSTCALCLEIPRYSSATAPNIVLLMQNKAKKWLKHLFYIYFLVLCGI